MKAQNNNLILKIRRKLGIALLGEQLALNVPTPVQKALRAFEYYDLPDSALAAYTRWFLALTMENDLGKAESERDAMPVAAFFNMRGALHLAHRAHETDADEFILTLKTCFGGKDTGIYQITTKKLDAYDFGEDGIEVNESEGAPTSVRVTYTTSKGSE